MVACVPPYRAPTADQPHAVVKLRRVYEKQPGPYLRERVLINEHEALARVTTPLPAPASDAILVHPEAAYWTVGANFFHHEMRSVQERYPEQEAYSDRESYSCGSYGTGGNASYRTCYRTVTRYRTVYKTRWVTKQVEVSDGSCSASLGQLPENGGTYLLQFTYQDHGACRLSCFEQSKQDEAIRNTPCQLAPPPED